MVKSICTGLQAWLLKKKSIQSQLNFTFLFKKLLVVGLMVAPRMVCPPNTWEKGFAGAIKDCKMRSFWTTVGSKSSDKCPCKRWEDSKEGLCEDRDSNYATQAK